MSRPSWKGSQFSTTLNVQVGFMAKAMPVEFIAKGEVNFVKILTTDDWLCRAVTGTGRGRLPLKHILPMVECMKDAVCSACRSEAKTADAAEDPMMLLGDLDDAHGVSALADTPGWIRKRKKNNAPCDKRHTEVIGSIRLMDVLPDVRLLTKPEREAFHAISVQVLVSVDRHRYLYVCGEDLEIFLRFLAVVADREGVPHAEVNHQPPAMAAQWFDVRTARWHVRESTGQVRVSDPVPRTTSFGVPMSTQEYRESKEKARISICEAGQ